MLADRVVGKEGIPTRERSSTNLQRSRKTSGDQHVCAEHGLWSSECCGQPSFGGCGRWTPTVRWSPIGSGHDTCVSSPGRRSSSQGSSQRKGVVLASARRKKARTYLELVAAGARARLVVLALGGRWSQEASTFVKLFAKAKVRSEPAVVQRRMEQAWRLRWSSILACAAARAFAGSLLGLRGGQGVDGQVPHSHEVECDFHHAGLVTDLCFSFVGKKVPMNGQGKFSMVAALIDQADAKRKCVESTQLDWSQVLGAVSEASEWARLPTHVLSFIAHGTIPTKFWTIWNVAIGSIHGRLWCGAQDQFFGEPQRFLNVGDLMFTISYTMRVSRRSRSPIG